MRLMMSVGLSSNGVLGSPLSGRLSSLRRNGMVVSGGLNRDAPMTTGSKLKHADLDLGLALDPKHGIAWYNLGCEGGGTVGGRDYSKKQCYAYEQLLALDPKHAIAWYCSSCEQASYCRVLGEKEAEERLLQQECLAIAEEAKEEAKQQIELERNMAGLTDLAASAAALIEAHRLTAAEPPSEFLTETVSMVAVIPHEMANPLYMTSGSSSPSLSLSSSD
jgi:hypothetical protein